MTVTDPVSPPTGRSVLGLDPASYAPHPMHGTDATWAETNCSVDMWVEVLHSLGLEPSAAFGFALSGDLLGDQWTFLKFPVDELYELYGLTVDEFNLWRPVVDQAAEQLEDGRLVTVEVDAYWLPDAVDSYQREHQKTTILLEGLDRSGREARYFHGAGFWALRGEDFDGALSWRPGTAVLPPYAEVIGLARLHRGDLRSLAFRVLRRHLDRRAAGNPVQRLAARLEQDLPWLQTLGPDGFHGYAFGTIRQCGAGAQLLERCLRWLDPADDGLLAAADAFGGVSSAAKSLQFSLARAARGRLVDVTGLAAGMVAGWEAAVLQLERRLAAGT